MNKEQIAALSQEQKEQLKLYIEAFIEGKTVQVSAHSAWRDIEEISRIYAYIVYTSELRIKPKNKVEFAFIQKPHTSDIEHCIYWPYPRNKPTCGHIMLCKVNDQIVATAFSNTSEPAWSKEQIEELKAKYE